MGVSNLVAAASGLTSAIKSLQTGSAATAGTITITSVNTSKAVVMSFPTGAAGTVAVSGGVNGMNIGLNAANGGLYGINTPTAMNSSIGWMFAANPTIYGTGAGTAAGINYFQGMNAANANYQFQNQTFAGNFMSNTNSNAFIGYTGVYQPVNVNAANGSTSGGNFNTGSNNLYAASYGAYLTNATTITVTGPCQWQVVEYN